MWWHSSEINFPCGNIKKILCGPKWEICLLFSKESKRDHYISTCATISVTSLSFFEPFQEKDRIADLLSVLTFDLSFDLADTPCGKVLCPVLNSYKSKLTRAVVSWFCIHSLVRSFVRLSVCLTVLLSYCLTVCLSVRQSLFFQGFLYVVVIR